MPNDDFLAVLPWKPVRSPDCQANPAPRSLHRNLSTPIDTDSLEAAKGIILSGGPASVFAEDVPAFNPEILNIPQPILGLCQGHQLMAQHFGGRVANTGQGEFGKASLRQLNPSPYGKMLPTAPRSG